MNNDQYIWIMAIICGTFIVLMSIHMVSMESLEKIHHPMEKING